MSEETKKDPQDPAPPAPPVPNEPAGDQPDILSMTRRELISAAPKLALGLGLAAAEQEVSAFNGAALFFKGSGPSPVYGLWAFGKNDFGQLGLGDQANRSRPTRVGSLNNWVQISMGFGFAAGLRTDGTLWAFGENLWGCMGLGDTLNRSSPVQVGTLSSWKSVIGGLNHGLALRIES